EHNLENALAAVAAAASAGVGFEQAVASLKRFEGVKRRLERTATIGDIIVYDDFAHHPTAIERTLAGMRKRHPGRRIVVALEPRSNTMKMGVHNDRLAQSLREADRVFVYRPDGFDDGFDRAFDGLGDNVTVVDDYDALVAGLEAELGAGDRVVFMSNGGFGAVRQKLTLALQTRAAADP
ncbi:MAG: cyanophycin synthetase, partial [Woeseiaceae bacterium]|nr:cyanophycin synthetase [Woeseiaceae bacterium]